ncbi:MAG: ATP-binding cassette domain-containing protein [Raoultibacter sp.]
MTFSYGKKADPVYCDFNLQVAPGERVALCAPSGFGKTTLCRMLAGFERPQSGCIMLDDKPLPTRGICPVQMVWQHPETAVDPRMRMRATLLEAGPVREDLCHALGIKPAWMSRYPHELSGGELQRFCIVRALSAEPRYLVADEISTMLDAVTQAQIWDFLVEETTKRTIGLVFVSHSVALTSRIATRVVDLVR